LEIRSYRKKNALFFFVLTVTVLTSSFAFLPAVHAGDNVETSSYLSVEPNPVGVGQQVNVYLWLLPNPPVASTSYHSLSVEVTKPDGTIQTVGSIATSLTGTYNFVYEPNQVGTWYFQLNYPGETIGNFNILASQSPKTSLTVQQQQIQPHTDFPLPAPNQNWTFPISGINRLWSSISGNWLMRGYNASYSSSTDLIAAFNPYTIAPNSAHVVWTYPITIGGLVGGEYENLSYYSGLPLQDKLSPPIVISGKVYFNLFGSQASSVLPGVVCLDLRTGKELWRNNDNQVTCGQLYDFESADQTGVVGPYLWSTETSTYYMYDAATGNQILNFTNAVPSGPNTSNPIILGNDGTMFVYVLEGASGLLALWNSTKAFESNGMIPIDPSNGAALWRPISGTFDWSKGIEWNVTTQSHSSQNGSPASDYPEKIQAVADGVIVTMRDTSSGFAVHSAYDATTGKRLWSFDRATTTAHDFTNVTAFGEGIYAQFDSATRSYYAYNILTGEQLWQSDAAEYPWGAYVGGAVIAYDRLYSASDDGHIYAFFISNGTKAWEFSSGNTTETIYGTYPFHYGPLIANGILYASTGEQVPPQPLYRGERLYAINATSGTGLWNMSGSYYLKALAQGYLLTYKVDDDQIYCFGKGETTTTVSLSSSIVENGTSILIQGTITDNSPAEPGTPCVSRDYMGGWLQYLLMQKPCPYATIPGVPVELRVLLSNGTLRELGMPISSEYGQFNFTWTPPEPGKYAILARFPGDNSYYVTFDWAESDLLVTTPTPTATSSTSSVSPLDIVFLIAVLLAIALSLYAIIAFRTIHKAN